MFNHVSLFTLTQAVADLIKTTLRMQKPQGDFSMWRKAIDLFLLQEEPVQREESS